MTGPLPPSPQAGSPDDGGPPRNGVSWGRAAALLIVAILVGILMVHAISQTPSAVSVSSVATTTTTTTAAHGAHHGAHHGATTTTSSTIAKSSIKVLSANGTNTKGAAEFFTTKLQSQGWQTLTPVDTTTNVNASNVYYANGQQQAALQVAEELGLKKTAVLPLTTSVPVQGTTGVDVVLVVGPDLGAQVTTTTG